METANDLQEKAISVISAQNFVTRIQERCQLSVIAIDNQHMTHTRRKRKRRQLLGNREAVRTLAMEQREIVGHEGDFNLVRHLNTSVTVLS